MPEPFEARRVPEIPPTDENIAALKDICTAVSGFPYPGHRSEAIVLAVSWLRTQPEMCKQLGLGVDNA